MKIPDRTRITTNAFLRMNNNLTCEMVSRLPFDAITFDMQHGLCTYSDIRGILPSLGIDRFPMARLSSNDPALVMQLLDLGVHGLICPQVNTATDAKQFADACYYPPLGTRSFGPMRVSVTVDNYVEKSQTLVFPIALIETQSGMENLEAIASTPGIKGLYVGPYDLSLSLGLSTLANFDDPELWSCIEQVASAAKQHNLVTGIQTYDLSVVQRLKDTGYQLFGVFDDHLTFADALSKKSDQIQQAFKALT